MLWAAWICYRGEDYGRIRIDVHRETEGHLELATWGTTSVIIIVSSILEQFFLFQVAITLHDWRRRKAGGMEGTYEIFAISMEDL